MEKFINTNLISLKCVIFLFLAGVGCLFPFLALHLRAVEMSIKDACIISIVAPFISIIGPLIAGPLADKLSVGRGSEVNASNGPDSNQNGNKVLRFMLALCFILSALFYGLLLAVPSVKILEPRHPSVSFMCSSDGALIYQEMCAEKQECNQWEGVKKGSLILSSCKYACEKPPVPHPLYLEASSTTETPDNDDDSDSDTELGEVGPEAVNPDDEESNARDRRDDLSKEKNNKMPHLCYRPDINEPMYCYVYLSHTKHIEINVTLLSSIDAGTYTGNENETSWCKYPLGGDFQCNVPQGQIDLLTEPDEDNTTCKPVIECMVDEPYESPDSVLSKSLCKYIGDPIASFWIYLLFRSLGDIFATAAFCLICTACVIATRETSLGRGDVGRQLAFGVIGMAIIPPIVGIIHDEIGETPSYLIPFIVTIVLFIMAALIMIFDTNMPLTPPEWWWHTKSGMLALPMNTVRRYSLEINGVLLVLLTLGIFWSTLDTYLAWTVNILHGSDFLISLTMTIGAIPAIAVLWKAEQLVDYCGHSNIFISAFTFYIIRYTGMALMEDPWFILLCEIFEVFTLSLVWVTAVFYIRHLIPRRYTATGQALAVVAHFCIGRGLGALIGYAASYGKVLDVLQRIYQGMAIAACCFGLIYLLLYHLLIAPMCRETITSPPNNLVMQGVGTNGTSNGSYTPLRVYHNERGRKGHFRY